MMSGVVTMTEPERLDLDRIVESLTTEFAGIFAPESVAACAYDSYEALLPARVQTYLPLMAHRFAKQRLNAVARAQGKTVESTPLVLFVCTHNAGRSQMAAALLAKAAEDRVTVASAGTKPAGEVEPQVLVALAEVGVDATDAFPKPLTDDVVGGADVVVTMGCGDACPVLPGRRYLDWDLPDPMGADLDTVRNIRADIDRRVQTLLAELVPSNEAAAH